MTEQTRHYELGAWRATGAISAAQIRAGTRGNAAAVPIALPTGALGVYPFASKRLGGKRPSYLAVVGVEWTLVNLDPPGVAVAVIGTGFIAEDVPALGRRIPPVTALALAL